jgi:hypothetical protein
MIFGRKKTAPLPNGVDAAHANCFGFLLFRMKKGQT